MNADSDCHFAAILAFVNKSPGAYLYRLDYLPRREFDRVKSAGGGPALFERCPALRVAKLFNNLLHAMIVDSTVLRELEHFAHIACMVRSAGDPARAARFGESRMKAPVKIEEGSIAPVSRRLWPLRTAHLGDEIQEAA